MAELYSKYDNMKNGIKSFFSNLIKRLVELYHRFISLINNNKGISILLAAVIIFGITGDYIFPFIWATVLYLLTILYKVTENKKEKEVLELLDLEGFKELNGILDSYVEECYNRDVGFFNPNIISDYISEKEQKRLMQELKDSVASNMSVNFRKKLELYYGENRVDSILATKCFIFVTLLAANNNQSIYNKTPVNAKTTKK